MERVILPRAAGPLVVALDEADRLFRKPYKADFFSMLRLWHNNRVPLTPAWEDLDLALAISTEPYLLIDQSDRSPFNVGLSVEMGPFSRDECRTLNEKYGGLLAEDQVEQLWTLLRGHPYLTRLAYYRLTARDKCSFAELLERADDERGPFGDHLRALLMKLHERRGVAGRHEAGHPHRHRWRSGPVLATVRSRPGPAKDNASIRPTCCTPGFQERLVRKENASGLSGGTYRLAGI